MRRIEARIDVAQQRVTAIHHLVFVNAPVFLLEVAPVQVVVVLDQCVRGETGAKNRRHVVLGPAHDVDQRLPEGLLVERGIDDVGAGNDQRIEPVRGQLLELEIVLADMFRGFGVAFELRDGKRVDVELRDRVAAADQANELPLGGGECRVRHHIEQADVQLADVLLARPVQRQYGLAALSQHFEGRQAVVCDEWHGA